MLQRISDSDAYLILSKPKIDDRGSFTKMYSHSWLQDVYKFNPKENFSSVSFPNVLRGFHLQINEDAHAKIVSCMLGEILDVIVDLRKGDKFGRTYSYKLSAKDGNAILIPKGYGHAFLNIHKDISIVNYLVESEHSPQNDVGVRWNSVDFYWPISNPIISDRDKNFQSISDFYPQ